MTPLDLADKYYALTCRKERDMQQEHRLLAKFVYLVATGRITDPRPIAMAMVGMESEDDTAIPNW